MATDILISSDPWENRVAVLEDGALAEIYFEREEKVIGSIYKGKVQNVLAALGASFVDIGLGRNAFLYVDDINRTPLNIGEVEITQGRSGWTISEKVSRGDDVLVQIVKEPRGLKGARVSTNVSLPGRYLILMPNGKFSGVSRKIESPEERNRLKTIMKAIRPEGMATIVRTAAANVSQAELIADLGVLIRMWHGILETYKRSTAPALIHRDMNLVYKAARDFITPDVDRVLIDDAEEFEKVRDFMRLYGPQYVDRIEHYNGGRSLFADFKIDSELEKLLRPKMNLPSGGSIVIETTEALTVIDVNSGKSTSGKNLDETIVRTNVEAAAEIARQVRLRDIGGIIVCDFIDMSSEASRNKVIATLEGGLRRDRTRTTIQSFSALGLLEFTRKRIGKDLASQLRGECPTCEGLGKVLSPETVAIDAFRKLRHFAHTHIHPNGRAGDGRERTPIEVHVAPTVGAQLEYWYEDEMAKLERELGTRVNVMVDPAMHPERSSVSVADGATAAARRGDAVRVGDEIDVDLLHAKLPDPTSAVAVVGNRLVEVKDAASAAGQRLRIKIVDVDDEGNILAEPRVAVAQAGEGRRRRRRGGRGRRKPLTAAEQAAELRELAEEAAHSLGGRTVAIGISTSVEAEQEAAAAAPASPPLTVVPSSAASASYFGNGAQESGEGSEVRRRRRRRRRRRPGVSVAGIESGEAMTLAGIPARSAELQTSEMDRLGPAQAEAIPPTSGPAPREEGGGRRRRRRRRRRGRSEGFVQVGAAETSQAGGIGAQTTPDRHIFRVNVGGSAEATGASAPPEPSRAIAKPQPAGPVAVEPPPPSLKVAEEKPKAARPTSRRRTQPQAPRQLESTPIAALPSTAETSSPPRRGRKTAAAQDVPQASPAPPEPRPKARTRKVASRRTDAADAAVTPKRTREAATASSEPPAKTSRTKASSTAKAPAKKKSTAKKSPSRKKSS
ncbi:MAG: Rne/Rng family ribonuclease [Candidatus Eremiobacteraeota bacterium]|nr:Rne/Rng family ribonuclease [Candidatus Eremiobacteraeota bacterium]MBV9645971.1 Rne/Rng family ribonuclease [Candidatus Eremiobacteraeota bacterium]